jgi:PAS domain S-box-containing protein
MIRNMGITLKLSILFVLFAALMLAGVSTLAYTSGRQALQEAATSELFSTAIEKQAALNTWVDERLSDLVAQANTPNLIAETRTLMEERSDAADFQTAHDHLVKELNPRAGPGQEYLELMILEPESGEVIVSTQPGEEGKFKEDMAYFIEGKQNPFVQNFYYSIADQAPAMTVSAPIRSDDGRLLSVLVGRLDLAEMNSIINLRTGLLQTIDAILVTSSNLFATQPRFITDAAVLQRGVHTEAVNLCLEQTSGVHLYPDYRGVPVIGVYRWLSDRNLCLIVKIDQAEAFAPALELGKNILWVSLLALLIGAGLAFALARTIAQPVLQIVQGAEEIGRGNLGVRIPVRSRDEIGILGNAFNQMAAVLMEKESQLRRWAQELERRVVDRTNELRASEHLLNETQAISKIGGWEYSLEKKNLIWTDEVFRIYALEKTADPNEVEKAIRFYSEQDQQTINLAFQNASEHGQPYSLELQLIAADGTHKWVRMVGDPVSENGKIVKVVGNIMDITERKMAEKAIQDSENRYRVLAETSPDMIFVIDTKDTVLYINGLGARQFGTTPEKMIGKPRSALFPAAMVRSQGILIQQVLETGAMVSTESVITFHGGRLWLDIQLVPLFDEAGKVHAVMGVSRDISERKQAELIQARQSEDLARSNAELERFAYVASHDLQEPLRMVISYLQLLERRYGDHLGDDAREFIAYAVDGSNRMKTLINDLLAYSRVGTRGAEFTQTDCEVVLARVLTNLKVAIEEKHARITHDSLPTVFADGVQLEQLFQNLVWNGIKFNADKIPSVHISVSRKDRNWVFAFKDNGIGIDPQYFERIFIIFQRLHTRKKFEGTGIGLAIGKRIVERLGGRIWVESLPGHGSTFYFSIPFNGESPHG